MKRWNEGAVITTPTVGYGHIVPVTVPGKFVFSLTMIIGYALIAVQRGLLRLRCRNHLDREKMFCMSI